MLNDENTQTKQVASTSPNPRTVWADVGVPNRVRLTRGKTYLIKTDNDVYCQVSLTGSVAEFAPPHAPKIYGRQPEYKGTEKGEFLFFQAVNVATDVTIEEAD